MRRTASLVMAAAMLTTCSRNSPKAQPSLIEADKQPAPLAVHWSVEESMAEAAAYLMRHCSAEGRFDYLRRSSMRESKYNLLRHAGAIYSLQQYYQHRPSPELLSVIRRASHYLRTRYIRPVQGHPTLVAAISRPKEERLAAPTAKLGGTALALVALTQMARLEPDFIETSTLQAMGRFLLFMQKEDGSFHSKFREDKGFDTNFHSLFYPGETMLALTMLYQIDGDETWILASAKAAAQLEFSRRGVRKIPADHWMMLASLPLLGALASLEAPPITEHVLLKHVERIAKTITQSQRRNLPGAPSAEEGSFEPTARSTPAATRLEGLGALATIQRQSGDVAPALQDAITAGISMLRRCQTKDTGPDRGGMPRRCGTSGEQGKRDREIRIDYVQHYLSALLSYHTLFVEAQ